MQFRALLIGDVVGKPGRRALAAVLPDLLNAHSVDVIVVNAENAAGGSGITPPIFEQLRALGADVVTLGDHVYRKKEILPLLAESDRLLRPANLPDEAVGRAWTVLESQSGFPFAVTILLGRTFMKPAGCPFHAVDACLDAIGETAKLIFVEVHAEATSDRIAMGWYLDGRVTAVYGTHTHVQTADARILPGGTAYITDLGMTGPHDGVLGRRKDKVLSALITGMPTHFDVARGDLRTCGVLITADTQTGRATAIERLCIPVEITGAQEAAEPPAAAPAETEAEPAAETAPEPAADSPTEPAPEPVVGHPDPPPA